MTNIIRDYAEKKQELCAKNDIISDELYQKYGVYRGLRDNNGKGVLTGLTTISKMVSFKKVDGVETPCDGELWYRGYNVKDLYLQHRIADLLLKDAHICCFLEKCPRRKNLRSFAGYSESAGVCRRILRVTLS